MKDTTTYCVYFDMNRLDVLVSPLLEEYEDAFNMEPKIYLGKDSLFVVRWDLDRSLNSQLILHFARNFQAEFYTHN